MKHNNVQIKRLYFSVESIGMPSKFEIGAMVSNIATLKFDPWDPILQRYEVPRKLEPVIRFRVQCPKHGTNQ